MLGWRLHQYRSWRCPEAGGSGWSHGLARSCLELGMVAGAEMGHEPGWPVEYSPARNGCVCVQLGEWWPLKRGRNFNCFYFLSILVFVIIICMHNKIIFFVKNAINATS
jgi:hypothetical protein